MDALSEVFVNNWLLVSAHFLGIFYSNIVEKKKLKQKLKNDILEIFIPVFNAGNEISIEIAENAYRNMNGTFQLYKRIYPVCSTKKQSVS